MAVSSGDLHLHRYPQYKYVDAVRWLHTVSAFDRFVVAAVHDSDAPASAVEIHSLNVNPNPQNPKSSKPFLDLRSSWPSPSRISSLRTSQTPQKHLVAALSTFAGSIHFLFVDPMDASLDLELSTDEGQPLHAGPMSAVDLQVGRHECVSVGEDGRVNLVSVGDAGLDYRRLYDSRGLVPYTAVKWGSEAEFATGGLGFELQWWDQRKPGGMVSQFKGNRTQGTMTSIVHSIDIHPSRKHICVAGGSSGTVFAWDLRCQRQPILLSGVGLSGAGKSTSESEVWDIQYDIHSQLSTIGSASSSKILPIMICTEDGILAVVGHDEAPIELLAEDCAINSLDIDPQSPSDVICGLEWETVGILMRQRPL